MMIVTPNLRFQGGNSARMRGTHAGGKFAHQGATVLDLLGQPILPEESMTPYRRRHLLIAALLLFALGIAFGALLFRLI